MPLHKRLLVDRGEHDLGIDRRLVILCAGDHRSRHDIVDDPRTSLAVGRKRGKGGSVQHRIRATGKADLMMDVFRNLIRTKPLKVVVDGDPLAE